MTYPTFKENLLDNQIFTRFYTDRALDAFDFILELVNHPCLRKQSFAFSKNRWCSRWIDGEVLVRVFDFLKQEEITGFNRNFRYKLLIPLMEEFTSHMNFMPAVKKAHYKMEFSDETMEDATAIAEYYINYKRSPSDRIKKLVGKPFDPFKIGQLDVLYEEYGPSIGSKRIELRNEIYKIFKEN